MNKKFIVSILIIYVVIFAVFVSTMGNSSIGEKTILTITNRKYDMIHTSNSNYEDNGENVHPKKKYHLSKRDISDEIVYDGYKNI